MNVERGSRVGRPSHQIPLPKADTIILAPCCDAQPSAQNPRAASDTIIMPSFSLFFLFSSLRCHHLYPHFLQHTLFLGVFAVRLCKRLFASSL